MREQEEDLVHELDRLRQRVAMLEAAAVEAASREKALLESEERCRTFAETLRGLTFRGNLDFTPVFFQGAVESLTGYTERELLAGCPRWDQLVHPDDRSLLDAAAGEIRLVPGYTCEREYRIVTR
ncbi:MAG TPA: PAS domain-containing protein, partial [Anaerolineae bacterium]|nr:PAS domain-containing protein [Anaerolineae bacterium]